MNVILVLTECVVTLVLIECDVTQVLTEYDVTQICQLLLVQFLPSLHMEDVIQHLCDLSPSDVLSVFKRLSILKQMVTP